MNITTHTNICLSKEAAFVQKNTYYMILLYEILGVGKPLMQQKSVMVVNNWPEKDRVNFSGSSLSCFGWRSQGVYTTVKT